jgi:predicted transcriptional regulator
MDTLFPLKGDFRIVRLRESDVIGESDHLRTFSKLVLESSPMYPGIRDWLGEKVIPGLGSNERVAYIGFEGERPIVSAVLRRGQNAKFCHLRIQEDFQDIHLGQIFFTQMAFEIRRSAKEVHFTLPESLWSAKREFFTSFGFENVAKATRQYRPGDTEMICSAPFTKVWSCVIEKLPSLSKMFSVAGYSIENTLLLSVKPSYAEKIIQNKKTVEVRRKFSEKWIGHRLSVYASKPVGALVGEATVEGVVAGKPDDIWCRFGWGMQCSKEEFEGYVGGSGKIFAITLGSAIPYASPIPLDQVTHILGNELTPPQSYLALENNQGWASAVSVAAFLHGTFRLKNTSRALSTVNQIGLPTGNTINVSQVL